MDCVSHLRLTVVCGPPDNSEGKVILYIDKMCELGTGERCRMLPRTAISARAPGEKNIQPSRYPSMYEPAFSPTFLKCATHHLWENLENSHSNDVFQFCGLDKDPPPQRKKAG